MQNAVLNKFRHSPKSYDREGWDLLPEILQMVPCAVWVLDDQCNYYYSNDAFTEISGFSREELRTKRGHDLMADCPEAFFDDIFAAYEYETHLNCVYFSDRKLRCKSGQTLSIHGTEKCIEYGNRYYCFMLIETDKAPTSQLSYSDLMGLRKELESENTYLKKELKSRAGTSVIGDDKALKKVLALCDQAAPTDATVLVLGETGTGKELLAQRIHDNSLRKNRPLIKVNCAALPANLIESELFGHEKGAFTGALTKKQGRFHLADRGTLFLDEIGDLPLALQAKLLRVLQDGEFESVGGTASQKVNVRIIAATNHNLKEQVAKGEFRADLYYRLNVFPLNTIPLRQRKDDIPALTRYFLQRYAPRMHKQIHSISRNLLEQLMNYDWPGNIRELENIIERGVILCHGKELDFDPQLPLASVATIATGTDQSTGMELVPLQEYESSYFKKVLKHTRWKISGKNGAAEILGLKPSTLEARLKKHGISRPC